MIESFWNIFEKLSNNKSVTYSWALIYCPQDNTRLYFFSFFFLVYIKSFSQTFILIWKATKLTPCSLVCNIWKFPCVDRCIAPGKLRFIHQTVILINIKVFTKSHFTINALCINVSLCCRGASLVIYHLSVALCRRSFMMDLLTIDQPFVLFFSK